MHIKYRPKTLDEVVGNSIIKKAMLKEIQEGPLRPMLFEGQHGSGKTTLAYIIANMFGAPEENITDLNCVYFSKIEDMRERIASLSQSSLFGRKQVLILDELHELSAKTQQVLLKPLESLPENILVLACTTTTSKVKDTLLERFIRFRVKALTKIESLVLLDRVCAAEEINLPKWLKQLLIDKSDGIPRRLLTGLAKVRDIPKEEEARFLLDVGIVEEEGELIDLFKILINKGPWKSVKSKLSELLKEHSPESIRVGLMNIISGRMMSDFSKELELGQLSMAFDYLRSSNNFPERANIIWGVYQTYCILNMAEWGGTIRHGK